MKLVIKFMVLFTFAISANAGNGFYTSGFGAVSSSMAGVDLAISSDTSAFITNPAGILHIKDARWDLFVSPYNTSELNHSDEYNSEQIDIYNKWGAVAGGGYARRLGSHPELVVGFGLNVQGGVGYTYKDLNTAYETVDDISSIFAIVKASPGIAWQASSRLRIGASMGIAYAEADQRFFYDTSYMRSSGSDYFFGSKLTQLSGHGVGFRFGMQYEISKNVRLASAYSSETKLDLKGGSLTVNYESIGFGRVRYDDAKLSGLVLPQEFGIGAWINTSRQYGIGLELSWYDWSANDEFRLDASKPNKAAPVVEIHSTTHVGLKRRLVYGLAIEYYLSDAITLRGGYSYSKQVMTTNNISPIFALIPEHDFALGLEYKFQSNLQLHTGIELQPRRSVKYTNSELPFGADAREANEVIFFHFQISQIF